MSDEVNSRSQQKRIAAMKGEPMPTFSDGKHGEVVQARDMEWINCLAGYGISAAAVYPGRVHVDIPSHASGEPGQDDQILMPNGSFTERAREIILAPCFCGVPGHFKFQQNGSSCLMCQREERAFQRGQQAMAEKAAQPISPEALQALEDLLAKWRAYEKSDAPQNLEADISLYNGARQGHGMCADDLQPLVDNLRSLAGAEPRKNPFEANREWFAKLAVEPPQDKGDVQEEMGQPYCSKHSPKGITCVCDVAAAKEPHVCICSDEEHSPECPFAEVREAIITYTKDGEPLGLDPLQREAISSEAIILAAKIVKICDLNSSSATYEALKLAQRAIELRIVAREPGASER